MEIVMQTGGIAAAGNTLGVTALIMTGEIDAGSAVLIIP
jgi:hypothetical protein